MSRAQALIRYDGDALRDGTMDVRDLAPALLALGEVVEKSNRDLNGDRATVSVRVQSDFRSGSFCVDLAVVQSVIQETMAFVGMVHMSTAGQLLEAIANLISISTFLKGDRAQNRIEISIGDVQITNVEGDQTIVNGDAARLYQNPAVRKALERVIDPIKRPGIDVFELKPPKGNAARVEKDEADFFAVEEGAEPEELTSTQRLRVKIIRVVFEPSKKWILYDGERKLFARITDPDFWTSVNAQGESFMKGDELVVEMNNTQTVLDGKTSWEHEVVRVLRHDRATDQQLIPFPEENGVED